MENVWNSHLSWRIYPGYQKSYQKTFLRRFHQNLGESRRGIIMKSLCKWFCDQSPRDILFHTLVIILIEMVMAITILASPGVHEHSISYLISMFLLTNLFVWGVIFLIHSDKPWDLLESGIRKLQEHCERYHS